MRSDSRTVYAIWLAAGRGGVWVLGATETSHCNAYIEVLTYTDLDTGNGARLDPGKIMVGTEV